MKLVRLKNQKLRPHLKRLESRPVPLSIDELIFHLPHPVLMFHINGASAKKQRKSADEKPMRRELESRKGRESRSEPHLTIFSVKPPIVYGR